MPRKYRLQAVSALFALAVLGCEQGVSDIVGPPTKDIANSPTAMPFDGTAAIVVGPVGLTAGATSTRTWDWTIALTGAADVSVLPGELAILSYSAELDATYTDSDWEASGVITITAAPFPPPSFIGVGVDVGGIAATVTCPGGLPVPLLPGLTLTCTYVAALPNGDPRTTTATVVDLASLPPTFTVATAPVVFVPPTEVDASVVVTDSNAGPVGSASSGDPLPHTIPYSADFGPFTSPADCGDHVIDNTASFTTNDTGTTGSDNASATITVECTSGPIDVLVDIKPGSDDNPINLGRGDKSAKSDKSDKSGKRAKSGKSAKSGRGNANLPVAILGTADFDVTTVDLSTVTLGESQTVGVTVKKNGMYQAGLKDVNSDGYPDLVMHFRIAALVASFDLDEFTTELCVNGSTSGGDEIAGCDFVTIVGGGGGGGGPL